MPKVCPKCSGLMVMEQFLEFYGPSTAWKCINCGWLRADTQPESFHHATGGLGRHSSPRLPRGYDA